MTPLTIARRGAGDCVQSAGSFRACAKQTPADGSLNERERFLGFARLRLGRLRTELHRRQPIFGDLDTRLGLL